MKIARYSTTQGEVRLGLIINDGIIDLAHLPEAPSSPSELIENWSSLSGGVAALAGRAADHQLDEVTLLAPLPRPGKILALGLNYADHAAEADMELPAEQFWFCKQGTCINDPFGRIELPKVSSALDYEAELVFVIGKRIRHATREQAKEAIFGFMCGNDVSVRDWQFKTTQVMIGKSFDSHAPIGPWIVTADEVDPHNLDIRCLVNGEKRQSSNTHHFIFDCYDQVEYLSKVMTLEPGDIVFTGTPSGVGAVMQPPRWLKEGDVVRVEIDGIGAIENVVRAE
ncbi:fumarylacetoacetate hydrolase family protein [Novosphingobium sp. 9U]|uniref:fumarylacetoacetate hydrolase family protein n=1 Tax=Novosphingobium sp. 9U TaxID=2653158 RepID=UPI0012F2DB89|nr:fumarylacetoacetate hydrolase family protein [Novosphingobium sp. 9U]VWX50060.1 2-keto-4-pentenoate hydratase/2-oxohepta-3-ene-1,7-dioic acid hydratase (Catechol pathway) [Novosphingobium sp. 9U]